jgi:hypothetical protein
VSREKSRIGRVIGNSQSKARIGSFTFRADPSLQFVPDYSPLGRQNSHYADGSQIHPRNESPARIGLKDKHRFCRYFFSPSLCPPKPKKQKWNLEFHSLQLRLQMLPPPRARTIPSPTIYNENNALLVFVCLQCCSLQRSHSHVSTRFNRTRRVHPLRPFCGVWRCRADGWLLFSVTWSRRKQKRNKMQQPSSQWAGRTSKHQRQLAKC